MEGFVTTSDAKSKSRYTYYKVLDKVKKGEFVRIRHGVYAKPEQLAGTMIDIDAIVPNGILCMLSAWVSIILLPSFHSLITLALNGEER